MQLLALLIHWAIGMAVEKIRVSNSSDIFHSSKALDNWFEVIIDSGEGNVERKPSYSERRHDDSNYPQCAVFALLQLENTRLNFVWQMKTEYLTPPDSTTHQCVTDDDNEERNDVAEQ